ncbi:MAG: hypothetical protein CL398_07985 [Acidiferrobacteraceae bacterium]|nr:hypothetical protein [Acidiferrobacteraceae bacterium]
MQIELRQLQQQLDITFLFVTHDQEEALTLSDRIAVMSEGKVLEIAEPNELYESPNSRFVADFIGTMNFFKGRVTSQSNNTVLAATQLLGNVVTTCQNQFSIGAKVWIAIRPEKLIPQFDPPGPDEPHIKGTMTASAYLGDRSHFYVHIDGKDEPVLVALQNLERATNVVRSNQDVWLRWSESAAIVLERN